jgi:hypothetical protein
LNPKITKSHKIVGNGSDFYHGFGQFETSIYEISITFAGETHPITFGNLPQTLLQGLMQNNTEGILGNDIFKYFNIYFELKNGIVIAKRRNGNTA